MTSRVLFVCLGNICRSPTAEAVFEVVARRRGLDVAADSAGTGAWHLGEPPDPRAAEAAAGRGYDLSGQRARRLDAADFDRFDLILAMDRDNLAGIERLRPPGDATPAALFLGYGRSGVAEVPDPYYGGGFGHVLDLIEDAAEGLADQLQNRSATDPNRL